MSCEIVWHPEAVQDQRRLFDHLKSINPIAAQKAALLILRGAESLQEWPNRCREMDDASARRELFIQFGSDAFVLRYVVEGQRVIVLRVWHSKEFRG